MNAIDADELELKEYLTPGWKRGEDDGVGEESGGIGEG